MTIRNFIGVALAAVCLAGCLSTFPHENLALPGLLGVDFDAPYGGELPTDTMGLTGAGVVTAWIDVAERPTLKLRGYRFPGAGAFDSKADWTVEEWADRKTGRIDVLKAELRVEQGRLRQTPESDDAGRIGARIRDFFGRILGAPSAERYIDGQGRIGVAPVAGPCERNFLWVRGPQAIRLGILAAADGATPDGTVTIEVQRLDALPETVRKTVLSNWGVAN